ncbi:MAG: SBBP repeat-containing protein [Bacteroidia bacterium]
MQQTTHNITRSALLMLLILCSYAVRSQTPDWVKNANHSFSGDNSIFALAIDNTGNSYAWNYNAHPGYNFSSILKYDALGNLTDTINVDSIYNFQAGIEKHNMLISNNAGLLYAYGFSTVTGFVTVIKLNTSGVKQWQYNAFNLYAINDMTLDKNGNLYICGDGASSSQPARVEKLNSNGILQWSADFNLNNALSDQDDFYAVKVDTNLNVYLTGRGQKDQTTQFKNILTAKYNSAGVKQWSKEYFGTANDDDAGYDLAVDNAGNAYVTGYVKNTGVGADMVTIKYTTTGAQQWVKLNAGNNGGDDFAYRIALNGLGNVVVAGTATQNACSNNRLDIVTYDAAGNKLWSYQPTGCQSFGFGGFGIDINNNIYGTGTVSDVTYPIYTNQAIYKISSAGAAIWNKEINIDTVNTEFSYGLAIDASGNAEVYGTSTVKGINSTLLSRFNTTGSTLWTQTYLSASTDPDNHVTVLADKNGNSYTIGNAYNLFNRIFIDKRDKSGNLIWRVNKYSKVANLGAIVNAATIDSSGNIYLCGSDYDNSAYAEMMVAMYNSSGTELWSRGYKASNGFSTHQANDVTVDVTGNVYITGTAYKNGIQGENIYTLKYNSTGVQQWVATYNGLNFNDAGIAIDVDTAGSVFVAGNTTDATNSTNWITLKYNNAGVQQWATLTGATTNNDVTGDIKVDKLGGCYVTGQTAGAPSGGGFTTIKFSTTGSKLWTKIIPSCYPGYDIGKEIKMDNTGNIFVTGTLYKCGGTDPDNIYRLYCQKYNSNGDSLWSYTRSGINYYYYSSETKHDVSTINNLSGAVYLTNVVYLPTQVINFYKVEIIKINQSNGALQWVHADSILSSTLQGGATFPYPSVNFDGAGALYSCYDASTGYNFFDTRTVKFCEAPVATASVTVGAATTFCQGGSVAITANAANVSTYLWTGGATTKVVNANTTANYKCTVTYTDGCPYVTNGISVTVNPLPGTTITPSGATTFCSGGSLNLTAGGAGTLLWSTGSSNATITVTASGTYKAVRTSSFGCKDSATVTVTVNPLPAATITSTGVTTYCAGTTPLTLTANAGTGLTYKWKKAAAYITGATAQIYKPTATGTYTVEVTNTGSCSALSAGVAVTVKAAPTATITASGPLTFCAGDSVVLNANTGTGLTYKWKKGTATLSGATLASYTAKTAATYKVVVTNSNGCSKTSAGKTVVINCKEGQTAEQGLALYPNPSDEMVNLNFMAASATTYMVTVIDVTGRTVLSQSITSEAGDNNTELNISSLANGIYLLKLTSGSAEQVTRLVKN